MGNAGRPRVFGVERAYRQCSDRGMTLGEAAAKLGVTKQAVLKASIRYGIRFKGQRRVAVDNGQ